MRYIVLMSSLLFASTTMPPSLSWAQNKSLLDGFLRDFGKARDNLNEGLRDYDRGGIGGWLDGIQKRTEHANQGKEPVDFGYCQIWRGKLLSYRAGCEVYQICKDYEKTTCVYRYVWEDGRETVLEQVNPQTLFIDGGRTEFVVYGNDVCFRNTTEYEDFCYTKSMQPDDLEFKELNPNTN